MILKWTGGRIHAIKFFEYIPSRVSKMCDYQEEDWVYLVNILEAKL